MIWVFYVFAAILVWLSAVSIRDGFRYRRFFLDEIAKPISDYTPYATIFAPCRGADDGLQENLSALSRQQYPEYEIIFVVDSEEDPAAAVINNILKGELAHACEARLVVAAAAKGCSQKVANLREAVLHVSPRSEVFVFVDSDVRPSATWLREMVAPLADGAVGAATGYRWFISRRPSFGSELRAVWNASIASALGPTTASNFCWGGSMALRREVFDRIGMREKWVGTLSDDFAVTRAMNEAKLPIVFVPQAISPSVEDATFLDMLEFTTRQIKITRVYAPHLWLLTFFGTTIFNGVMLAAVLIAIFGGTRTAVIAAWATLISVCLLSTGKAWIRLSAVRLVLTDYERDLAKQVWTQNTLWLIAPVVFLINCVAALISRRMTWRGTRYELISPRETVIMTD